MYVQSEYQDSPSQSEVYWLEEFWIRILMRRFFIAFLRSKMGIRRRPKQAILNYMIISMESCCNRTQIKHYTKESFVKKLFFRFILHQISKQPTQSRMSCWRLQNERDPRVIKEGSFSVSLVSCVNLELHKTASDSANHDSILMYMHPQSRHAT